MEQSQRRAVAILLTIRTLYVGDTSLSMSIQGSRKFCLTIVGIEPATFGSLARVFGKFA